MLNQEILGGLRLAVQKGENLYDAMMTLYNAGYVKEEIEEAAKVLQQEQYQMTNPQINYSDQTIKQVPLKKSQKKISKKVSNYESSIEKKPKEKASKGLLIAVIVAAMIFVGILIAYLLLR